MTAELQDCNGAVRGLQVESDEVEVQANVKAVLIGENLELDEEKKACHQGVSENLELDEDKEGCNGDGSENFNVIEDVKENLNLNEDESENLKLSEDKTVCNGDETERLKTKENYNVCNGDASERLKMKEDYNACNGDQSEILKSGEDNEVCNGDRRESLTLNEDETVSGGHVREKLKLNEDPTVCNGDGRDNLEWNEGKTICNGDLSENSDWNGDKTVCNRDLREDLESICNSDGIEVCAEGADDDDNLSVGEQCEPDLASVQAKSSDHVPELDAEDPESHRSETADEVRDLGCLASETKEDDTEMMKNGDGPFHREALVEEYPEHEVSDLVSEQEEKHELQCLENEEFEVEIESVKIEETKVRVDADHEVGAPDWVNQGGGKPEQDFEDGENQENKAESPVHVVQEFELQGGVLTEEHNSESLPVIDHNSQPLPVVDMNSELVTQETQNLVAEETKPESRTVNDKSELDCSTLENGHDTSDHVINEVQNSKRSFVINLDDFPALQSAVDKTIEFESHVVVTEENKPYLQCLPNGSNETGSHLDVNDENGIESQCFVSGSSGLISDDIHGENDEEFHHGKDEICDIESGSCNESNIDGVSDALIEKSGVCNGTEQSGMQEDIADSADWVSTVGLDPSKGTLISGNVQKPEAEVFKKSFFCMVKIPRHVDNKIKAQIRLAQLQLNEKTESRDFVRAAIQMKRASREQMLDRLRAARQEERVNREAIRSKRQEMEPVQLTLIKMKTANSVEEFDEKIYQMQYRIEHESMPLREEKQLLREMKQLKISRDELCAIAGSHSELQEAFDNADTIHGRNQLLGQEMDSLKRQAYQAEKNTQAIEKDFEALNYALRELQAQWSAADDVRQEAYEALRVLKKQEYEKNNEFYQNKADIQEAKRLALARERDALDKLCSSQVDRIIEMWVKNSEFRKEYMKDNERSTLRRLETLDGRSLGPDEEPPLPTNYADELDSSLLPQGKQPSSGIRPEKEEKSTATLQQSNVAELKPKGQQSPSKEVSVPHKDSAGKSKKSKQKDLIPEIESFEVSSEPVKNEEENLAKKAEEAAKLKETRRLEEMRKAKEAEERKRRLAERANAKALARAQKDLERKEKERQKKANKKAAAAATTAARGSNITGNDIASSETQNDASQDLKSSPIVEAKLLTSTTQKSTASQRKKLVSQKAKTKSIFPAAAKKGRKGIQTWMWILLAVVFCIFLLVLWFYF